MSRVYLETCFVMVCTSLFEYATVGFLRKRISMRKARNQQMSKMAQEYRQRCVSAAAAAEGSERCPPLEAVLLPGNAEVTMVKSAFRRKQGGCQKMLEPPHLNKLVENPGNGALDLDAIFGKKADRLFGFSPSDIDKYSRVVFSVFFV